MVGVYPTAYAEMEGKLEAVLSPTMRVTEVDLMSSNLSDCKYFYLLSHLPTSGY